MSAVPPVTADPPARYLGRGRGTGRPARLRPAGLSTLSLGRRGREGELASDHRLYVVCAPPRAAELSPLARRPWLVRLPRRRIPPPRDGGRMMREKVTGTRGGANRGRRAVHVAFAPCASRDRRRRSISSTRGSDSGRGRSRRPPPARRPPSYLPRRLALCLTMRGPRA